MSGLTTAQGGQDGGHCRCHDIMVVVMVVVVMGVPNHGVLQVC